MDLENILNNAEEPVEQDAPPRFIIRDASFALSP